VAASGLAIEVFVRRTAELIHLSDCCMAVSGSVSLELLYHSRPTVILYWITPLAFALQRRFRKVKYITLVNLLVTDKLFPADTTPFDPDAADAQAVLFPEYLTCEDKSPQIAKHVIHWLTRPVERQQLVDRLAKLKAEVAHGGAATKAAEYILDQLDGRPRVIPRPHFIPRPTVETGQTAAPRSAAA
jgi:lipid-A-disaccharide synthase